MWLCLLVCCRSMWQCDCVCWYIVDPCGDKHVRRGAEWHYMAPRWGSWRGAHGAHCHPARHRTSCRPCGILQQSTIAHIRECGVLHAPGSLCSCYPWWATEHSQQKDGLYMYLETHNNSCCINIIRLFLYNSVIFIIIVIVCCFTAIFSSPKDNVLKVSFCDGLLSVVCPCMLLSYNNCT